MQSATLLEAALKRDRLLVAAGIAGIVMLAWAYMAYLVLDMAQMDMGAGGMTMPMQQAWGVFDFALMFIMWGVMMVAMMVPSAAPMVLMFAAVNRRRREQDRPYVPSGVFISGYLAVWVAFAVAAGLSQWGLHTASLVSESSIRAVPVLGGVLLLAAGVYQLTPLKYACLARCRSPLDFIMTEWRDGIRGAVQMGLRHGLFCLGCCWVLMALLFVLGVMNLLWIAALAAFVLAEKILPQGRAISRVSGVLMMGWGGWMIATTFY